MKSLHQTAIAHKHIGVVVNDVMARLVKLRAQRALGNRQTDGVRQTLTERPGGGLYARRVANLRMTRRFRMQLAEVLISSSGRS